MLGILVGSLIFLGYCLGFTRLKRWPAEAAPLLSISFIVSVLYVFTYFAFLRLGAVFVSIGGGLSLLSSPLFFRKQNTLLRDYISPGLVTWAFITLIIAVFAASSFTLSFDDFRHWMPHAQAMILNSGFITNNGYSANNSYTPGPDLFYYIFSLFKILPVSSIRFAQTIVLMSPFALIFSYSKWKNWKIILGLFSIVILYFLLICDYPLGIKSSGDPGWFIGLCFGAMLLIYYQSKRQWQDIALLLPIVFGFSLMKPKVMPLVILLAALITVDQLYTFYKNKQKKPSFFRLGLCLFISILICALAFVSEKSWDFYLSSVNIAPTLPLNLSQAKLANLISGHFTQYQLDVLHRILYYSKQILINVLPLLIFVFLSFYLIPTRNEKYRFLTWQILLFAGFLAYLFGLVLLFMYGFSTVVMVDCGFVRFSRLYINGWTLFLLGVLYHQISSFYFEKNLLQKAAAPFSVIVLTGLFAYWSVCLIQEPKRMPEYLFTNTASRFLLQNIPEDKSFFIQQEGGNGLNLVQITYALLPRTSDYDLATDSHGNAPFSLSSLKEEAKTLNGKYNYLVLNHLAKNKNEMVTKLYKINGAELSLVGCYSINPRLCSN